MSGETLTLLLTPSRVLHWLLMLLPLTITVTGIFGAALHEAGNRRLALMAGALTIWLFLPVQFADPDLRAMSTAFSILAWIGLVGQWARHVWTNRPEPVLCHAMVLLHLLAIVATEAMTLLWHCC